MVGRRMIDNQRQQPDRSSIGVHSLILPFGMQLPPLSWQSNFGNFSISQGNDSSAGRDSNPDTSHDGCRDWNPDRTIERAKILHLVYENSKQNPTVRLSLNSSPELQKVWPAFQPSAQGGENGELRAPGSRALLGGWSDLTITNHGRSPSRWEDPDSKQNLCPASGSGGNHSSAVPLCDGPPGNHGNGPQSSYGKPAGKLMRRPPHRGGAYPCTGQCEHFEDDSATCFDSVNTRDFHCVSCNGASDHLAAGPPDIFSGSPACHQPRGIGPGISGYHVSDIGRCIPFSMVCAVRKPARGHPLLSWKRREHLIPV